MAPKPTRSVFIQGTVCCAEESNALFALLGSPEGQQQLRWLDKALTPLTIRSDHYPAIYDSDHPVVTQVANRLTENMIAAGVPVPGVNENNLTTEEGSDTEQQMLAECAKLLPEHWDDLSHAQRGHMLKNYWGLAGRKDITCTAVIDLSLMEDTHMQRMYDLAAKMARRLGIPVLTMTTPFTESDALLMEQALIDLLRPLPECQTFPRDEPTISYRKFDPAKAPHVYICFAPLGELHAARDFSPMENPYRDSAIALGKTMVELASRGDHMSIFYDTQHPLAQRLGMEFAKQYVIHHGLAAFKAYPSPKDNDGPPPHVQLKKIRELVPQFDSLEQELQAQVMCGLYGLYDLSLTKKATFAFFYQDFEGAMPEHLKLLKLAAHNADIPVFDITMPISDRAIANIKAQATALMNAALEEANNNFVEIEA